MTNTADFKVVVLGKESVGKTAIVTRYCLDNFAQRSSSTIGASFQTKREYSLTAISHLLSEYSLFY
jgi:GTPase SAR1 family protein